MSVTVASRGSGSGRLTRVYEFFDTRVLDHLWFIAICDGASVQLIVPTFGSERAARIFERCLLDHPSGALLSLDGQLELARRIEDQLVAGVTNVEGVCGGLMAELR